jgi:putative transposase
VPEHIILVFQLPYCPDLNPIERLWEPLKADLKWASFKTLEQLQAKVDQLLSQLTPPVIASLIGYSFILDVYLSLTPFKLVLVAHRVNLILEISPFSE